MNSMSDLFHPEVPDSFIDDVFDVMQETPRHTYQVSPSGRSGCWQSRPIEWPENVWMGVSVENARYRFRVNHLRQTPAKTSSCPSSR